MIISSDLNSEEMNKEKNRRKKIFTKMKNLFD